jgi:two-component sensor histidine kinase
MRADDRPFETDYRPWLLPIAGGAVVLGFMLSVQFTFELRANGRPFSLAQELAKVMPYWLLWAAAAPFLLWTTTRVRARYPGKFLRQGTLIGLAALAAMIVHSALLYKSQLLFNLTDVRIPLWQGALAVTRWRMPANLLVCGALVGLVLAREAQARELFASRLVEQLATARLHALRMQLNPHFLFNSLNSVSMLVRRGDSMKAVQVVAGLSDLLRQLLADTNGAEVSLEQELTFVKQYLAIEQARFGDALRTEFDVAPDAMRARVPSLLLQPIVENAVRHGAGQVAGEGLVVVRALRRADRLVLEVIDNGPGPQEGDHQTDRAGLGIKNTVERLTHLHGERFGFDLSNDGRSTVATIELPYSTTPNGNHAR